MQNKCEPNKNKVLAAVILEKLFDQTKKIIKNTLSYLTIFSLVFSSALINTAYATDGDTLTITGTTVDETTASNAGTGNANVTGGTNAISTQDIDLVISGDVILNLTTDGIRFADEITSANVGAAATLTINVSDGAADETYTIDEAVTNVDDNDPLTITFAGNADGQIFQLKTQSVGSGADTLKFVVNSGQTLEVAATSGTYSANFDGAGTLKLIENFTNDEDIGSAGTGLGILDMNSKTLTAGAGSVRVGTLIQDAEIVSAASLEVTGVTTSTNANITTTGTQTYTGVFNVGAGTSVLDANDSLITFSDAVTGGAGTENLTVNSGTARTEFDGIVSAIETLTIADSGGVTFDAAVTTNTAVVLTDTADNADIIFAGNLSTATLTVAAEAFNVEINEDATITNAVTFSNTGLLVLGDGTDDILTFNGGLVATAPSAITLNGKIITGGTNTMTLGDTGDDATGITLADSTTLESGGAAAININGALAGASVDDNLTINSNGTTTINGVISGIGTFITDTDGKTVIAANISSDGLQTYGDNVEISGDDRTITTTNDAVTFSGLVNSITGETRGLTVAAGSGLTTFNLAVGVSQSLGAIAITGSGGLDLNADIGNTDPSAGATSLVVTGATDLGGNVTTTGLQTYTDAVTLSGAARTLTSTASGAVLFSSTIDGTQDLTVATGGLTTFDGLVGNTTILGAIDISGTGGLDLDANIASAASLAVTGATNLGANVTTTGAQIYTGNVTQSAISALTTTNSNITFGGTVIGDGGTEDDLTINVGSGTVQFQGAVGGTAMGAIAITGNLDLDAAVTDANSLTVTKASNLGASVTTSGVQTYGTNNADITTISTDVTLTTTDNNITMRSIDGAAGTEDLAFNTGSGEITVEGDVTDITILTLTDSGGATFNGSVAATTVTITDLDTAGDNVIFNDTLTATTLNVAAGNVAYDVELNGGGTITNAVTFSNTGTVQIGNSDGDEMLFVNGFTVSEPSALTFGGKITTTNTAITLDTASTLNANTTFNAGAAAITINDTIQGGAANSNLILTNTGAGNDITIGAILGATTNIGNLTVTSGGDTLINADITTSGNQVYNSTVIYSGNRTLTGANVQFASSVTGGASDTLAIAVGNLNLDGAADVESLTVADEANFAASVEADAGITVSDKTTIEEGLTVTLQSATVTTGNITLEEVVGTAGGGDETLVLNSGTSTISVTGAVSDLANLTIAQSGGATFGGAVTLSDTLTLTDTTDAADIIFNGFVTANTLDTQNPAYDLTFNAGGAIAASTDILSTGILTIGNDADDVMTFAGGFSSGSTGGMNLAGTLATTNTVLNINRVTVLTADSTISAGSGAITIAGTVDGNFDLNLNTTTGVVSIDSVIGGGTAINTLTTNAGGSTSINANITTTSDQTYLNTVDIEGETRTLTSNGGAIFFDGTVDSLSTTRRSLVVNAGSGLTTFDALVGGTNAMGAISITGSGGLDLNAAVTNATSLAVTGATDLGGNVTTTDLQTYTGAVTLSGATRTLTSSGGSTITFGNTIDGTQALNVNTAGTTVFNGNVGSGTALGAIDIVTGAFDLNANITSAASLDVSSTTALGGNITTLGAQVYSGTITLDDSGSFTLDSTGNDATDDITTAAIAGVNGGDAENLTLDAGPSGDITIGGAVSDITNLTITDSNGVDFNSTVTLLGDLTFTDSSAGADINFNGDISANDLVTTGNGYDVFILEDATITAQTTFLNTGTLQIGNQGVGAAGADVSTFTGGLVATAASGITLAGTINTSDTMTLGDGGTGITLAGSTTLSSGSGTINIAGAMAGADDNDALIINSTGTTNITAAISGITTLTTNAIGTTAVSANISSSGQQTFNDAVTVDGTLDFTASQVEFNSTLQGADGIGDNLTISGILDLNAAATNLTSLDVEGSSDLAANVTTSGTQEYTGASVMSGDAARTLTGSTVLFGTTVDGGAQNLTIDGILNLNGALTNTTNFEVTSSSTLAGNVTTTGTQIYTGAVTLSGAARTLTATNSSAVTFSSTIDGTQDLTVATGGLTTFDGIVGGGTAVSAIAITGTGGLDLDAAITSAASLAVTGATNLGANVTTSGDQTYTGAVTLSANNTYQSTANGDILFSSTTDGAQTLATTTGGDTTYVGAIGGNTAILSLTAVTAGFTAADIKSKGAVSINNSGTGSITGVISDGSSAASLTKLGAGTLTLTGANTYTGNTTITNGDLSIDGTGQLGSGTYAGAISVGTGDDLIYTSTAAQTLSGVISGLGGVVKEENSVLTLSGDNTFTGLLDINDGEVIITGGSSGTANLAGSVAIANGAILTVSTDLTNGDAISSSTSIGQVVTGATINMPVNLVNNQLLVWNSAATNASGIDDEITDINAALVDNILIDYVASKGSINITGVNKTPTSIASAISSTLNQAKGLLQGYISAVSLTTDDDEAEAAFKTAIDGGASNLLELGRQVAPQTDMIAGSTVATKNTTKSVENILSDRMASLRSGDAFKFTGNENSGVYAESMFFQVFGSAAEQKNKTVNFGTQFGYDLDSAGFSIGSDAINANGDLVGLSVSYSNSNVDGKGTGKAKNKIESYLASIYTEKLSEKGYVEGSLSVGYNENKTSRIINTSGLNRALSGDYDSMQASFKVAAGRTNELGDATDGYKSYVTPFISLAGSLISTDAYTETSSSTIDNLRLKIEQEDYTSLVGSIGIKAFKEAEKGTAIVSFSIDNEFGDQNIVAKNTYQGGAGSSFNTSTEVDDLSGKFGLGYSIGTGLTSFNIGYQTEFNTDDYISHTGTINFRSKF